MLLWNTSVRFIFSFLFQLPAVIDCLLVASTNKNNSTTVEHESVNAIAQYVEIFHNKIFVSLNLTQQFWACCRWVNARKT